MKNHLQMLAWNFLTEQPQWVRPGQQRINVAEDLVTLYTVDNETIGIFYKEEYIKINKAFRAWLEVRQWK
jgi:hypothetical protein